MNMNKDNPIIIEKVANGFIVRPHGSFMEGRTIQFQEDVFVFQTFTALVEWLEGHYTKVKNNND